MGPMFQFNQELVFLWGLRLAVLFICLPVHEFAHAWAAHKLGDDTAARQGRLTLNPFVHLDLFGGLLILLAGFGWAKPVPVNAGVFRHPRRDMAVVAAAGPLANIIMAIIMMSAVRIIANAVPAGSAFPVAGAVQVLITMLSINLVLAAFNLLPVPPLDGSKLLGALLPERLYFSMMRYERFVMLALIALVFTGTLIRPIFWLRDHLFTFVYFITTPIDMIFGR